MATRHYPVMLANVIKHIEALPLRRKFEVADCNFGLGGHSNSILSRFPNSHITGFDLDSRMLALYRESPSLCTPHLDRLSLCNDNFTGLLTKGRKVDVLLADLGFNSLQLEEHEGFSWNKDTPLHMLYQPQGRTCSDLIQQLSFIEIVDLLVKYGDLNKTEAKLAAKKIEELRPKTTFELRDSVVGCFQTNKTRKLAQVFQAFRIATNNELESLRQLCAGMQWVLNPNALVLLITFHSLERDIIMQEVRAHSKAFTKPKVEKPCEAELQENSRSKCAQMVVFSKK